MRRVIWLQEGTRSAKLRQQEFIDALSRDPESQFGAELNTGDLENLKTTIHGALKKLEKPEPATAERKVGAEGSKMINLLCDERDRKAALPLRKFLRDQGLDVRIPVFEGDADTADDIQQLVTP